MKYCSSCGNPIEEKDKFCSVCGASAVTAEKSKSEENNSKNQKSDFASKVEEAISNAMNTPETTADYTAEDIENNRVMAILAYIGILVLIPLFASKAKESPFVKYHTNQGLLLFIFHFIASALGAIPYLGGLLAAAANVLWIIMLVFGIINVLNGKAKELPVIGKFRILK